MTRFYDQIFFWPNVLTYIRILVIPLLVVFFYLPVNWSHLAAALVFAIASITDWLDGYLARYLKQTTKLGAFLDPVADKLIVSTALILIVAEPTFHYVSTKSALFSVPSPLLTIPAAIIVGREIIVSALRELMAELGKRASVAVSNLGKVKTAFQMLSLLILLYCDSASNFWVVIVGYITLYIASFLTIWSMCLYLKAAVTQLMVDEGMLH